MFSHMTDILHISVSTPWKQSHLAQLSPFSLLFPALKAFQYSHSWAGHAFTRFCHTASVILHHESFATQL